MKVKRVDTNEEFASRQKRISHDLRHVDDKKPGEFSKKDYPNSIKYEEAADRLAATPVKTSDLNSTDDVVGLIENYKYGLDAYVKYRKSTNELVVYIPSSRARTGNIIYTYYKADDRKYLKLFDDYYKGEINV